MSELDTSYQPQKDLYNKQISGVDPALEAEQQGLQAQKEDSFRGITEQANRRGLFYSGVPIAEQARYTGGQFLPALANLRGKYITQKNSLTEALNQLGMQQGQEARNIRQTELANDESARRFNIEQAARDRAAASAGAYQFGGGGGGGGNPAAPDTNAVLGAYTPAEEGLWRQMTMKPGGGSYSIDDLARDFQQTYISAQYGNARDKQKLFMYYSKMPETFNPEIAKGIRMPSAQNNSGNQIPLNVYRQGAGGYVNTRSSRKGSGQIPLNVYRRGV